MIVRLSAGWSSAKLLKWRSISISGNEGDNTYAAGLWEGLRASRFIGTYTVKDFIFLILATFILCPAFPSLWITSFLKYGSLLFYYFSVTLNIKHGLVSIFTAWSTWFWSHLLKVLFLGPSPGCAHAFSSLGQELHAVRTLLFLLPWLSSSVGVGRREKEVDVCSHPTIGEGVAVLFSSTLLITLVPFCEQTHRDLSRWRWVTLFLVVSASQSDSGSAGCFSLGASVQMQALLYRLFVVLCGGLSGDCSLPRPLAGRPSWGLTSSSSFNPPTPG